MKKYSLLLAPLFLVSAYCHAFDGTKKDTIDLPRLQVLRDTQIVQFSPQLQKAFLDKLQEEQGFWGKHSNWLIPLVVSIIFGITVYFFSRETIRRDKKYRDLAFTAEVDKLLIEHPELRGYDDQYGKKLQDRVRVAAPVEMQVVPGVRIRIEGRHSFTVKPLKGKVEVICNGDKKEVNDEGFEYRNVVGTATYEFNASASLNITQCESVGLPFYIEDEARQKIHAFCYYILNNFELALMHHNSRSTRQPWNDYLVHTYNKSTYFSKLVKYAQSEEGKKLFSTGFIKRLDKLFPENKTD